MPMKPDQAKPRDRAIERFLPEALQSAAGRVQGGAESACPDAELLAAYVGQGLAGDERDHLEDHFAACERCQKILAVLAAGDEVPLAEPETAGLGEAAVAAAPATPQSAARPSPSPQRWLWWLTPAFGAVAAALLWMVLRPASPGETAPVQTAADYSRPAEQETRSLIAPAAPSPAAEAPPADALGRQRQSLDSNLTARALPDAQAKQAAAEAEAVALPRAASAESAPAAPAARSAVAVTQAAPLAGVVTQGVTVPQETPPAPIPAPPAMTQTVTITEQMPLVGGASATLGGTLSQQPPPRLPLGSRTVAQISLYTFTSPDGGTLWRLGVAGHIERSTDRGQTWQQQTSGVTSDLVSGSAASKDVAWVVGRAGVILHTTDGERWQRVAAPAGFTGDWAAVVAREALSATVVAADLRRYSTEDGGRSWNLQ